jgi:hypothetical protein
VRFHCASVGDHARRFHRGLAELGVAGEFTLNALAFVVHQRAQPFELRDQISISLNEAPRRDGSMC